MCCDSPAPFSGLSHALSSSGRSFPNLVQAMFKTRSLAEGVCQIVIRQSCFRHLYCCYFNPFPVIILFPSSFITAIVHHQGTWSFGKYTCSPKAEDVIFPIQKVQKGVLVIPASEPGQQQIPGTQQNSAGGMGCRSSPGPCCPEALQSAPAAWLSSRARLELLCFCGCL